MKHVATVIPVFLLFAGILPLASASEDPHWPGWLGPDRSGWVENFEVPEKWPERLERRWRVEVGTGYGSPLVSGRRVFQHARQEEEEVVWCLDLQSGKEIWRKNYPVAFKIGGGAQRHGKGPKSSPVLADGRLFTLSITGVLSAWDGDTGELLWRRDFKDRFEKSYPYWGAATSPLVHNDRVIVHPGTCESGALLALDVKTGKEIWSLADEGHCYSSPQIAELDGVLQIVEWNHAGLAGIAPESGRLLWEYSFPHEGNNQNTPTPAISNGRILAGGENRGMRCLEPRLVDGAWTVTEHWRTREVSLDMSSAIINDDLLFGFSHFKLGQLFCLDPKSGEVLWQGPPRAGDNAMFLAVPGHVLALIERGELQVIKATGDNCQVVKSYKVSEEGETWTPPVLLPNGILTKDKRHLSFWALGKE